MASGVCSTSAPQERECSKGELSGQPDQMRRLGIKREMFAQRPAGKADGSAGLTMHEKHEHRGPYRRGLCCGQATAAQDLPADRPGGSQNHGQLHQNCAQFAKRRDEDKAQRGGNC